MMEEIAGLMKSSSSRCRISVAMATYNGEKYIGEQLDSIARQDLLPMELVITDDGSTDGTLRIAEEFARNAPFPVRIFRNEARLGYADNFLKAASLCQGDLVAFCDQDDIWMEQKLAVCSRSFADAEVVLAAHSAETFSDSGARGRRFPQFRTRTIKTGRSNPFAFPHGLVMVIRKELLSIIQTPCRPARVRAHDQWLWFLAASTGKIATVADPLVLYRQHQSNMFGARKPGSVKGRATGIAQTLDYEGLADSEIECARLLLTAAEQRSDLADRFTKSARRLELRAKFHRLRTRIYRSDSNLLGRAFTFGHICALGGYWPDSSSTRLGMWAAAKDLLFGVSGAYRLSASRASNARQS